MSHDPDFKQLWPQLSRDEESISCRVISNTVQNGIRARKLPFVDDVAQINPPDNLPSAWRNADDFIGLPNIGVDFPVNVFEFIQILNPLACLVGDVYAPRLSKRFWI
jgi:hypothetical protein